MFYLFIGGCSKITETQPRDFVEFHHVLWQPQKCKKRPSAWNLEPRDVCWYYILQHLVGGSEHFLFSIMYGMSSFPLTFIFSRWLFTWLLNHQPDMQKTLIWAGNQLKQPFLLGSFELFYTHNSCFTQQPLPLPTVDLSQRMFPEWQLPTLPHCRIPTEFLATFSRCVFPISCTHFPSEKNWPWATPSSECASGGHPFPSRFMALLRVINP